MKAKILGLLAVGLLAGPMAAGAVVMLDQSQELANNGFILSTNQNLLQQTFTVGTSGTLQSLDLGLHRRSDISSGSFTLSLLDSPGGTTIFSGVFSMLMLATTPYGGKYPTPFTNFDLGAAGISVAAGAQLTIALSNPTGFNEVSSGGCRPLCWNASNGNPYAGGSAYIGASQLSVLDYTFRSYVLAAVPEPGTLALLGLGLLGLGVTRRKAA